MSGTTIQAGQPLSSLPIATAIVPADYVLGYVMSTAGTVSPMLVPKALLGASSLSLAGGQMTGVLLLSEDATQPMEPVTLRQFNTGLAGVSTAVEQVEALVDQANAAAGSSAASATAAIDAEKGQPNGLATLNVLGDLVVGTFPLLNTDANGHAVAKFLLEDTNDGFIPVVGSKVIYSDGGVVKVA